MELDVAMLDTGIRAAAVMAVALLGVSIWRDSQNRASARLTTLLCVAIVAHLINVAPDRPQGSVWLSIIVETMSTSVPALFWLVSRSVFVDGFCVRPRAVLLIAGYLGYSIVFVNWLLHIPALIVPGALLFRAAMLAFTLAALVVAWRGHADDLVEGRRRLRALLVWSIGILTMFIPLVEVLVYSGVLPTATVTVSAAAILIVSTANAWFLLGLRDHDLLRRTQGFAETAADRDEPRMLAALDRLMATERLYREDRLGIAAVAHKVGVPEYRLRRLINRRLGHRNFAAYLNGYRLIDVKQALADPAQREVPILTIALDAGFGSLTPFNRAFRDAEAMTPSEYRQRALG